MGWLDRLAVQGTLKGLLQHHSSKASVLWRSDFFIVQLSRAYTTTGKTMALTRWTFVGKVISLLFNMLSRLVIAFLPRGSSVQFSHSVVSDSLQHHEPQHARPPCPSPTPGVYSNSCSLSQWCHPTISSSVIPFSSCLQSFPASGSFQMSQLFVSDGQSIGVLASTSVPPMNSQDLSPLGWTGWISKVQASFNFKAAISICSDFGAPQNKVCHCFHCFPIYLPCSDGTRCHDLSFLNVEI